MSLDGAWDIHFAESGAVRLTFRGPDDETAVFAFSWEVAATLAGDLLSGALAAAKCAGIDPREATVRVVQGAISLEMVEALRAAAAAAK